MHTINIIALVKGNEGMGGKKGKILIYTTKSTLTLIFGSFNRFVLYVVENVLEDIE